MKTLPLILAALAAVATQAAFAHTELKQTVPADKAVIASAPETLELQFSEGVRLTAVTVQKDGETKQSLGPLPADVTTAFSLALPALTDGHYVVTWRALSEDTHVMSGEFMFAIGAAGEHSEQMDHAAMPQGEHAEHMDHAAMPQGEHAEHMDHAAMPQAGHAEHTDHGTMPQAGH